MSGEFLGLQIAHKVTDVLWGDYRRYFGWRLDRIYEPDRKQHTKSSVRAIQKRAAADTGRRKSGN